MNRKTNKDLLRLEKDYYHGIKNENDSNVDHKEVLLSRMITENKKNKPAIGQFAKSDLLGKLQSFIPEIKEANSKVKDLEDKIIKFQGQQEYRQQLIALKQTSKLDSRRLHKVFRPTGKLAAHIRFVFSKYVYFVGFDGRRVRTMRMIKTIVFLILQSKYHIQLNIISMQQTLYIAGPIYQRFQPEIVKAECMIVQNQRVTYIGSIEQSEKHVKELCPDLDFKLVKTSNSEPGWSSWSYGGVKFIFTMGMLIPGFVDSHLHPFSGGINLLNCKLYASSWQEASLILKEYIQANPDLDWYFAYGYYQPWFNDIPQTIDKLDELCSDKPILIMRDDYHAYYCNSILLKMAGITETTEPAHLLGKDSKGQLNGYVTESLMNEIKKCIPKMDNDKLALYGSTAMKHILKNGIVGICDAAVKETMFYQYLEMHKKEKLIPWCNMSISWNHLFLDQTQNKDIEMCIDYLLNLIKKYEESGVDKEQLWSNTVKLFIDGVIESKTAFIKKCYCNCQDKGMLMIQKDELQKILCQLSKHKIQAHMHSIGDGATETVVECLAQIPQEKLVGMNNYVAHLQFVDPINLNSFKQLDLGANFTPLWFYENKKNSVLPQYIDQGYWKDMYPIQQAIKQGIKIGFGSDWPISDISPIDGIQVAVTRIPVQYQGPINDLIRNEEQCVKLEQALHFYTLGSAELMGRQEQRGSLEVGKIADFVILDRDLFEQDKDKIYKTGILATVLGGQIAHDNGFKEMITEIF